MSAYRPNPPPERPPIALARAPAFAKNRSNRCSKAQKSLAFDRKSLKEAYRDN
jgi:hypothetical protein